MKKLDFAGVLAALAAAVINRAVLLMMNPFGIAYFAAAYAQKNSRLMLAAGTAAGMAGAFPVKIFLKYMGIIAGIIVIEKLLKICRVKVKPWMMAVISGVLTALAGTAYTLGMNGFYIESTQRAVLVNALEGLLTGCLVLVFDKGVRIIYQKDRRPFVDNEAQLSLGCIIGTAVYAVWGYGLEKYSVTEAMIFFLLLFIGYKYGSAASAVAGAFTGTAMAFWQNDVSMTGLMCIAGAVAGTFRGKSRAAGAAATMVSVGFMGWLGAGYMLKMTTVRGILAGTVCFLVMPRRIFEIQPQAAPKHFSKTQQLLFNDQVKKRLKEFSESFKKLSRTFNEGVRPRAELSREEVDDAFDELTQNVCAGCSRCDFCWEREYDDTSFAASNILNYYSKNGSIEKNQLPIAFRRRCINIDRFLNETARVVEMARLNLNWKNKLMESRLAVAGQFYEVADIIEDFSNSLDDENRKVDADTKRLRQKLQAKKLKIKDLTVVEKAGRRLCVYLTAGMGRGRVVTTREICDLLSRVLRRKFVPGKGCRMVVSKEMMTYEFVEDTVYKTMEGVACIPKAEENVSGDAYTLIHLDGGQVVMSLADGMGSGETACEESEYIIHLMEQLIETGFGRQAAVRLINSVMFLKSEKQSFATVDMGMIDLYSGKCEFIKVGAAASFIKRKNETETIISSTLPVGAFTEVDYEGITKELSPGDMIFMVTDGVVNSFRDQKGETVLAEFIQSLEIKNPQEAAQAVLDYAVMAGGGSAGDDMSVLACGLYENTCRKQSA